MIFLYKTFWYKNGIGNVIVDYCTWSIFDIIGLISIRQFQMKFEQTLYEIKVILLSLLYIYGGLQA